MAPSQHSSLQLATGWFATDRSCALLCCVGTFVEVVTSPTSAEPISALAYRLGMQRQRVRTRVVCVLGLGPLAKHERLLCVGTLLGLDFWAGQV